MQPEGKTDAYYGPKHKTGTTEKAKQIQHGTPAIQTPNVMLSGARSARGALKRARSNEG